ncbi:MAG: S41 family peptidase [Clostridia bacterium]|nr:S41 family peptidase [Clostridia bacterium]
MNRKIPFSACLVMILIAVLLTYLMVTVSDETRYNAAMSDFTVQPLENPKLVEIEQLVDGYYVKDFDENYLSDSLAYGYVYGLGDPHAGYYTADTYREYINSIQGALTGIGIRVTLEELDNGATDRVVIFEVMENSPAKEAGVLPGDIIYSVEGTLYSKLGYDKAVNMMLGEEGTVLTFEVLRGDRVVEFKITRKYFDSQTVSYKKTYANDTIGYIRIYQFTTATISQFKKAVESLRAQGATKLIFDVRNNPGGEYVSITSILDYLLPEGEIIITTDKNGTEKVEKSDSNQVDMPMVVLANEATASAGELFTAALMDYDKAVFIGKTTYGKGTVQKTFPLSDGSAVKFSTEYYLPPSRVSYDGVGIVPDIEVELSEEAQKRFYLIEEKEDAQLMSAIEYLLNEK